MDNVIYTYYVYADTEKLYKKIALAVCVVVTAVWLLVGNMEFAVFSLITLFTLIESYLDCMSTSRDLIENNKDLRTLALEKIERGEQFAMADVRMLQDSVLENREKALFIPKWVRDKYLKDGNPYYTDLNKVRDALLDDETTSIPSCTEDIQIVSQDGKSTTELSEIHRRLVAMLSDVLPVFEKHNIAYTLDGGTLIGAIREKGRFIFWDDDVDLAIRYEDLARAKEALAAELGDKYDLQDYESDPYYSPRLSNLRVRERDSIIDEKDSPLFERYNTRGLFLGIYAYAPTLSTLAKDRFYRKHFIHPLHKKLHDLEFTWENDRDAVAAEFVRLKEKYMKRVDWYLAQATNTDCYAYTPNYIEDLEQPGPYFAREDPYGSEVRTTFAGLDCRVPTNSETVLETFYGKDWNVSPFKSIPQLKEEFGESGWYGKKSFAATKMKRLAYISLLDEGQNA